MRTIFLDANIILDFYRYGSDDLDEIQKLVALIGGEEITLLTNDHLHDEVQRNRDTVIAQMISELQKQKFKFRTPKVCDGHDEASEIAALLKSANHKLGELSKKVEKLAEERALRADLYISEMFKKSTKVEVDEDLILRAVTRSQIGNPPGKSGSIGDGIHWLTMLETEKAGLDLVTKDGDFSSNLNQKTLNSFLQQEWKKKKGTWAEVSLFSSLGDYLKTHFPNIKLSEEETKNELIDQLSVSATFATTHEVISKLCGYSYFTKVQVTRLFVILVENSQVGWIAEDDDVNNFYRSLKDKAWHIPDEIHEPAANLLGVDALDFFCPF